MDDLLADFVAETREMLEASEGELIAWEADPADSSRIDTIFRFVHTVKGNCGFFDFPRLEALSHGAEDALAEVRAGRRQADARLVTAVLAIIDRISAMVDSIEANEDFPEGGDAELVAALQADNEDFAEPASATVEHAPAQRRGEAAQAIRSIRLPVELLDRVMSGVSDMVLARNDLARRLREAGTQPTIDGPFERLTTILSDVRDAITRMRMQRIETLFGAMPRLVRDLSAELGKQVMIDLEGGDVELDREMIEMIRDPMTHIIRNAIDHGIEPPSERLRAGKREIGLLSIAARQSGNQITILVSDDGRGLDRDKIAAKAISSGLATQAEIAKMDREQVLQFIFEPGFSTAEEVSCVSGRGVGLDVVRANLEKVGGSISTAGNPGEGTQFVLRIPLTLSIIAGLTVGVADQRFAIPRSYVEEIVASSSSSLDFAEVGERGLVTFRGKRIPCLSLAEALGVESEVAHERKVIVLVELANGDLFALLVDRIIDHGDLVVKPLAPSIMQSGVYAGSTLLDDGQPILMLDMPALAASHGLVDETRSRSFRIAPEKSADAEKPAEQVMVFIGLDDRRKAVRLELVRRIETVEPGAIDTDTGRPRAVIDGEIVPVAGMENGELPADKVRLLRLSDGECDVLYAMRRVLDSAEITSAMEDGDAGPLTEGVTLIDGKPVTLLDGHAIFARFGKAPAPASPLTCRIPDGEWAATILAPLVASAGYRVTDDETADVEIRMDDVEALTSAHGHIIHLRSQVEQGGDEEQDTIYRYDRDGVIAALRAVRRKGLA